MDFKKLSKQANKIIAKRGGTESLKGDAAELAAIAKGRGTVSQKAKAAAEALKVPGRGQGPQR